MVTSWMPWVTGASALLGLASAGAWFYASTVKITRDKAVALRVQEAEVKGTAPNLAGVSLDGWDMSSTLAAQSKWSARGAALAGCAVALQAIGQAIASV